MAETLYIRLGSQRQDIIHWLIWSGSDNEIIASGELKGARQLKELTDKALSRKVIVFVPGSDVSLKSLKVPGKSQRAVRLAVPYMLEDELAEDVEQLFFAYANIKQDEQGNNCFTAVVNREQMKLWQSWLADAGINSKQMIPDMLAMPLAEKTWSAVSLGQQILLRQGPWQGLTLDDHLWPLLCEKWLASAEQNQSAENTVENNADGESDQQASITEPESLLSPINAYSVIGAVDDVGLLTIKPMPEELPLALLAQHCNPSAFNLLQGEFQLKEARSKATTSWFWAAGFALFALILNVGIKGVALAQLSNQQQAVEQQIITTYKQAFPESKRVRVSTIKSQLKQKLAGFSSSNANDGFLRMLAKLQPAFASVPGLRPESLKFDSKRQELRLQAVAGDYQQFDKFKSALEKAQLTVSLGAQNNQGEHVSGSFSIKG